MLPLLPTIDQLTDKLARRLPRDPASALLFELSNQAVRATSDQPAPLPETLKLLISPGSEKQPRARALIQLTHRLLPKLTLRYAQLTTSRVAKLSPYKPKLIAHGTAHNIFLINIPCKAGSGSAGKDKQYALKVNVHSQRLKTDLARRDLWENIKTDATKIRSWFGHIPGFLPHQTVTILNAPPMNRPAVVTIQPYIEGDKTDVFSLSKTKLLELLEQKPYLRTSFTAFINQLRHISRRTHEAPELAGEGNLVFVTNKGRKTCLMLLDANYVITPSRSRALYPALRGLHYARIRYLLKILKNL